MYCRIRVVDIFFNLFSIRFWKPCICSSNIWCFWLYVNNVTVTYIMSFFECLKWILFSYVLTMWPFDIRRKHTCVQTWKQSIHENKTYRNHMFLQTWCTFSMTMALTLFFLLFHFPENVRKPKISYPLIRMCVSVDKKC